MCRLSLFSVCVFINIQLMPFLILNNDFDQEDVSKLFEKIVWIEICIFIIIPPITKEEDKKRLTKYSIVERIDPRPTQRINVAGVKVRYFLEIRKFCSS